LRGDRQNSRRADRAKQASTELLRDEWATSWAASAPVLTARARERSIAASSVGVLAASGDLFALNAALARGAPRQARDLSPRLIDWSIAADSLSDDFVRVVPLRIAEFSSAPNASPIAAGRRRWGLAPSRFFSPARPNWYQPRSEGTMPYVADLLFDAAALAIVI